MNTRRELQKLAEARMDDAMHLLQHGRYSSAYYLVGYAIELALKACISRQFHGDAIPDRNLVNAIHTHKPDVLMKASGLLTEFDEACKENLMLAAYWAVVCNWSESSRYESFDAVGSASLVSAVGDPDNGVLQWLKRHW